jgi:chemotaxis signal transduction protein
VVAVYDLPVMLGYASNRSEADSRLIIRIRNPGHDFGISAESVLDVFSVPASDIRPVPGNFSEFEKKYISGIVALPESIALVLNHKAIVFE